MISLLMRDNTNFGSCVGENIQSYEQPSYQDTVSAGCAAVLLNVVVTV